MDLLPQNVLEKYFIGEMTMHYQKEIAPESIVDLYYGQEDDHFKIEFKIAEQIHLSYQIVFLPKSIFHQLYYCYSPPNPMHWLHLHQI